MRKLATIRVIQELNPIPDADAIECAVLDGWKVVVKKGEQYVGQKVVYIEIDSFIPNELAPFLSKGQEPKEYLGIKGERLRTVKLRGQLSQGLILPLPVDMTDLEIGSDVSEQLGIVKYERPEQFEGGDTKGDFPSFIPKTDQERIQNLKSKWDELSTLVYEVTEKLEGSSMTVAMFEGEFLVCSRNCIMKNEDNTFAKVAQEYLGGREYMIDGYALQGELVGPGIQGNYYALNSHKWFIFDVYHIKSGRYLNPVERRDFVRVLELDHVPVLHEDFMIAYGMDGLLSDAEYSSCLNSGKQREGIVLKNMTGEQSLKVVSNKYLLKNS